METKRTVKKTTKKASVNMSSSGKKATKATALVGATLASAGIKKTGAKGILIALLCFIIGIGAGFGGYLMLCKNDCFEILNGDDIVLKSAGGTIRNYSDIVDSTIESISNVLIPGFMASSSFLKTRPTTLPASFIKLISLADLVTIILFLQKFRNLIEEFMTFS